MNSENRAPVSVRLPTATRLQIERLAESEHRSLSGQIVHIVERYLTTPKEKAEAAVTAPAR